jgi:hypothetical protein
MCRNLHLPKQSLPDIVRVGLRPWPRHCRVENEPPCPSTAGHTTSAISRSRELARDEVQHSVQVFIICIRKPE